MEFLSSLIDMLIPAAAAQSGPCRGIADCGIGVNPLPAFIFWAAAVLLEVSSGLAVVFVVVGGAHLVLNFGNESTSDKGRKAVIYALIGFAIALSSQAIISFIVARTQTISISEPHLDLMRITVDAMLFVFNVAFALVMIYYGYKLLIARGQQSELDTVKKGIMYTVMGAIIINLSYALVRAVSNLGF